MREQNRAPPPRKPKTNNNQQQPKPQKQEHAYYASFGYHVTNPFAPASRSGDPEALKALVDAAHGLGIAVLLDVVHSHISSNADDGLAGTFVAVSFVVVVFVECVCSNKSQQTNHLSLNYHQNNNSTSKKTQKTQKNKTQTTPTGFDLGQAEDMSYFRGGAAGYHTAWDSRVLNYRNWEVQRYLLSNLRYWVEEFRFDGFR